MTRFDREIPPGREGKVKVSVNPRNCPKGSVKKFVIVKTNDPQMKSFFLYVTGKGGS
jgi:hypothetical protein